MIYKELKHTTINSITTTETGKPDSTDHRKVIADLLEKWSFASLLNIVFQITIDLLKDVKDQEERKKAVANFETNWKTMQQELFTPFEENSDWNNHLPKHPAVKNYVSKIITYLNQENYNSEKIRSFVEKFSIELEHRSNKEPDLIVFNDYRELQQEYKDLVEYLEHVETMKDYAFSLEKKPLRDYYIPHEAVLTNVSETWSLGNDDIRKKYANNIKNIRQIIEEELLTNSNRPYLLVGASFGTGKSSMSRMIASEYASNYLDKSQSLRELMTGNYIPIIVFLKYGLKVEYRGYNLDSLLKNIVTPENNKEASNREILLILDGLDEYENTNLIDKLEDLENTVT